MNQLSTSVMSKPPVKAVKVPVQYEQACRALAECTTIDEAKYWSDKSEALAAWAKIYKSDQALVEAKRLKLHAYRRMSSIAEELRPKGNLMGKGAQPGPVSLLKEQGFSRMEASKIRAVGSLPDADFRKLVAMPRPPSPGSVMHHREGISESWRKFSSSNMAPTFRAFCRHNPAIALARGIKPEEVLRAREMAREMADWLDEFEQHLPKAPKK